MMTSSVPIDVTTNHYISSYYDVLYENITGEYETLDDEINFVPRDNYVPQGLTLFNEYVLVSSYDYNKNNNSIICVYDENGNLINECMLEHRSHVGGIAYDKKNDLLWVSTYDGYINAYDIYDVLEKDKIFARFKEINVGNNLPNYMYPWKNSVSYLGMHNDELLVGNFSLSNKGKIKRYYVEKNDNKVTLKYLGYFKIPNMVQGVTFYNKDNQEYILFSRSFGRKRPSLLEIFRYDEEIDDYDDSLLASSSLKLSPMTEQIVIENDRLYILYESNAVPYTTKQDLEFDSISVIDANSVVKKLELKIDTY